MLKKTCDVKDIENAVKIHKEMKEWKMANIQSIGMLLNILATAGSKYTWTSFIFIILAYMYAC